MPIERNRTWQRYIPLLAAAIVEDLLREDQWLKDVAALAVGPVPITTLRALDIVAWRAGKNAQSSVDEDDLELDVEEGVSADG